MTQTGKPTSLADVIKRGLRSALADLHIALPARVIAYDSSKQSVDVQPLIKSAYLDEELVRQIESLPQIVKVPVVFPGAGGYRITFPIKAGSTDGDTGLIIFAEASLDVWLSKGGEVDPLDDHRSNLSDAIFIPGLRDYAHVLASAPTDRMTVGHDDGATINITKTDVNVGSNEPGDLEPATLATTLKGLLNSWYTTLSSLSLPVSGTTAGPPTPGTFQTVPQIESQHVKVKK